MLASSRTSRERRQVRRVQRDLTSAGPKTSVAGVAVGIQASTSCGAGRDHLAAPSLAQACQVPHLGNDPDTSIMLAVMLGE